MRHQRITKKFGRKTAHRKALLVSLVTNLILQGSIKITTAKAKQTRKDAEKIVTLARKAPTPSRSCSTPSYRPWMAARGGTPVS
jgi:ribosomal protein L17